MRRLLFASVAVLAWPAAAQAAPPAVTASASPATGAAPLRVTLTAAGDPATYHWDLGDGSAAAGPSVQHAYRAGLYTATVTATNDAGETAAAQVRVRASAITLRTAKSAAYGEHVRFGGRLTPNRSGARVAIVARGMRLRFVKTTPGGFYHATLRVLSPGPYTARADGAISKPVSPRVRASVDAALTGDGIVGSKLGLTARARPGGAGKLRVQIWRDGKRTYDGTYRGAARVALGTSAPSTYRVRVSLVPAKGWTGAGKSLRTSVFVPFLTIGSHGPSVFALEQRLAEQHYWLARVDAIYGSDTRDAVYAFQKVHGLDRTGQVNAQVWRVLSHSSTPLARYGGDHIEVDKTRQVLFVVRDGKVLKVTHVSTGATGNTPLGRWHVYAKTPGWLANGMFDSSFFLRGFAVHGYPSVPPYPASHGCVRVPVWLAPQLYGYIPWGSEVDVYL